MNILDSALSVSGYSIIELNCENQNLNRVVDLIFKSNDNLKYKYLKVQATFCKI